MNEDVAAEYFENTQFCLIKISRMQHAHVSMSCVSIEKWATKFIKIFSFEIMPKASEHLVSTKYSIVFFVLLFD